MRKADNRPLYRYRMTDAEYQEAKQILRQLARERRLVQPDDRSGAMFVAYCAEWFRREAASTFLRWDDPAPDLFPAVPYASKTELTRRGLKFWNRDLRVISGNREFLLTVALEGGVPVKVLKEGSGGWLTEYLRAVMRRATAADPEEILTLADEEGWRIRKSYRHEDFIRLCSELVERLLFWRATAEREAAGTAGAVRNSQLLDVKQPGWREDLPLFVAEEDRAFVDDLLAGLVDEKLSGLTAEGVGARRFLLRQDGQWVPALQILADGEVPPAKLPSLTPSLGRARAVPAGNLSDHLAGDLALFEPPAGEQRRWRVRPFNQATRLIKGFPLEAAIAVTLTSSGPPRAWNWPGGEALHAELLVWREDDAAAGAEKLLRFVRAGSVASSAATLYALCPSSWTIEPAGSGTVVFTEALPALGRKLVTVAGTAYFRSGEPDALGFRLETNAEEREEELVLQPAGGLAVADSGCELIEAPSVLTVCGRNGRSRMLRPGELWARRTGGRWEPVAGLLAGAGVLELSWRDPAAGIQLEKRRVALVPAGASARGRLADAQSGEIELTGLTGWSAAVKACEGTLAGPGRLAVRFPGRPFYRLPVRLTPPGGIGLGGDGFDILVALAGRDGCTALADGTVVRPASTLDLRALRGAVASAPRRAVLQLALKGQKAGGLRTVVEGELPLSVLRSGIGEMLAAAAHQDDVVEMEFLGDTRAPIRVSRYGPQALSVDAGRIRWTAPAGATALRPVARSVLHPTHEHALEHEDGGVWRLPERCAGVCLVYLRDGPDVVSRPLPAMGGNVAPAAEGSLPAALGEPQHEVRQRAIAAALDKIGRGGNAAADLQWLLDAATSLHGLPPSALDGLARLPGHPAALVRLLLSARNDAEHHLIWSLQNELPFLWLALPLAAWRDAAGAEVRSLVGALEPVLGSQGANQLALDRMGSLAGRLCATEPALAAVLRQAGWPAVASPDLPALSDLTSRHVAGRLDRSSERNAIAAFLASLGLGLPDAIKGMAHEEFAGLFAPLLLAASARGRINLDRELMLLARRTLREDPHYVSAAYPHLLAYYR